jgi:hypothetical protein
MRTTGKRLALRLFGLATFVFSVVSALGANEPWFI